MNGNRVTQLVADQQLVDGLTQHGSTIGTVLIDGKQHTAASIIQVVQGRIAAEKAVETTNAAWKGAVKANKDERANTRIFMVQVRQALLVAFASNLETLASLGIKPRKKAVPKPAVKVVAAKKAAATRQARGTAGKKQKAKVKGTPPATVTLPVGTPPVASPPAGTPPAPTKQ
jgi:hypothetical protein